MDSDEEHESHHAGDGSPDNASFTSKFLFGNVNKQGELEDDYFDDVSDWRIFRELWELSVHYLQYWMGNWED